MLPTVSLPALSVMLIASRGFAVKLLAMWVQQWLFQQLAGGAVATSLSQKPRRISWQLGLNCVWSYRDRPFLSCSDTLIFRLMRCSGSASVSLKALEQTETRGEEQSSPLSPAAVGAAGEMSFSSKGVGWWLSPDENPAWTEEGDGQAIPHFCLWTTNVLQEQTSCNPVPVDIQQWFPQYQDFVLQPK